MIRKLLSALLTMCVLGRVVPVMAQSISMSSSGDGNGVTIDITVHDPGGGPVECQYLAVMRGYSEVIAVIPRQYGTTFTAQVVDANVDPNAIYCYRMALYTLPFPVPGFFCGGDVWSLCEVFNCFYDIETCINTGPDPAFIGHGYLTSEGAVPNEVAAFLNRCVASPYPLALYSVSGTAQQYVDSGTAVDLYGTMERGGLPQGVWYYVAQAATPHSCVVATEQRSWGAVKSLYKN